VRALSLGKFTAKHLPAKAALFEDMVAERLEKLQRQGLKLGSG
jgi:hypothetical protein